MLVLPILMLVLVLAAAVVVSASLVVGGVDITDKSKVLIDSLFISCPDSPPIKTWIL